MSMSEKKIRRSRGFYGGELCVWIVQVGESYRLEFKPYRIDFSLETEGVKTSFVAISRDETYRTEEFAKDDARHIVKNHFPGRTEDEIDWRPEPEE